MTFKPNHQPIRTRRLLLAQGAAAPRPLWTADFDAAINRAGAVVCRTRTGDEAVRTVEAGGLTAAVLVEEGLQGAGIDVLSLMRIIRSVDELLPCWVVTQNASRRTLERALDLRVSSIIQYPAGLTELLVALQKLFTDPIQRN